MALGTIVEEHFHQPPPPPPPLSPPPSCKTTTASEPPPLILPQIRTNEMTLGERVSKFIIEARCTDNILFSGAMAVGGFVLVMQSFPIFMNNWVFLTEPRGINKTNENGEQLESTFHYNTGYFQICRVHINNNSGIIYDELEIPRNPFQNNFKTMKKVTASESEYKCYLNPLFSQVDLTDISLASLAVISIILCIAVLMVVCVVDDELAPRMKPNAAGEPSKFSYTYGPPFFSSALSFIPVQICACLHAFLYFRRYPSVVEKLKFVPGEESPARQRTRYPASGKFSEGIPSFIPADSEFFSRIKKEFEEI
uniref:CX domain-containing protein n=1 Tax=Caenorhabditis tropicalis TaxID=1561998 RepID=A0A1I7TR67_9PELO